MLRRRLCETARVAVRPLPAIRGLKTQPLNSGERISKNVLALFLTGSVGLIFARTMFAMMDDFTEDEMDRMEEKIKLKRMQKNLEGDSQK